MDSDAGIPQGAQFDVVVTPHPAGLRAHVTGVGATFATTLTYWLRIAEAVRQHRPAGLLLIDELEGRALGPSEWRKLVEVIRGEGFQDTRIAHVKPRGLERIESCEIHAREAGLDAHVFDNETDADLWLRYGER